MVNAYFPSWLPALLVALMMLWRFKRRRRTRAAFPVVERVRSAGDGEGKAR